VIVLHACALSIFQLFLPSRTSGRDVLGSDVLVAKSVEELRSKEGRRKGKRFQDQRSLRIQTKRTIWKGID